MLIDIQFTNIHIYFESEKTIKLYETKTQLNLIGNFNLLSFYFAPTFYNYTIFIAKFLTLSFLYWFWEFQTHLLIKVPEK